MPKTVKKVEDVWISYDFEKDEYSFGITVRDNEGKTHEIDLGEYGVAPIFDEETAERLHELIEKYNVTDMVQSKLEIYALNHRLKEIPFNLNLFAESIMEVIETVKDIEEGAMISGLRVR